MNNKTEKDSSILYIDCFSGISGDMFVGAALDLDARVFNADVLIKELEKIDLKGYEIDISKVQRGAVYGTRFDVKVNNGQPARDFRDIKILINESSLDNKVKELSLKIFTEVARAESIIHSKSQDTVHFHEVGAVDSIVDIVSVSIALHFLKVNRVYCSRVPLGKGSVDTMHGIIPVPAPATLEILKGVPVYGGGFDFEVTTPTGAAIIKVLVDHYGEIPDIVVERMGFGAGSRSVKSKSVIPNVLRLILGRLMGPLGSGKFKDITQHGVHSGKALLLSTNIDDSTPEIVGYTLEQLLESDVYDAWLEPVYMKKTRLSFKLCVLCSQEKLGEVLKLIFTETSTLGVRAQEVIRFSLKREVRKLKLPYGEVEVKIGFMDGKEITFSPEYSSCIKLAKESGKPLKEVYRDTLFFLSKR